MAQPVHGMLMAGRVLGDPFLVGAVAEHRRDDTTDWAMVGESQGIPLLAKLARSGATHGATHSRPVAVEPPASRVVAS